MYNYPCRLEPLPEEGGYLVTFRDIPWALTNGETLDESMEMAADVLHCALSSEIDDQADLPRPSAPLPGEHLVALPVVTQAKLALYEAMRAQKVTKVELARRLGVDESVVRKLCDLEHRSHMSGLEAAFAVLDLRPRLEIDRAA